MCQRRDSGGGWGPALGSARREEGGCGAPPGVVRERSPSWCGAISQASLTSTCPASAGGGEVEREEGRRWPGLIREMCNKRQHRRRQPAPILGLPSWVDSGGWTRTTTGGSKVRCPAFRRPRIDRVSPAPGNRSDRGVARSFGPGDSRMSRIKLTEAGPRFNRLRRETSGPAPSSCSLSRSRWCGSRGARIG